MALMDGMRPAAAAPGGTFPADSPISARETALSVAASLALHILAGIALVVVPLTMASITPPQDIAVDLLTPEQYASLVSTNAHEDDRVPVSPAVPSTPAPAMIRPTAMLSALALADPASARARKEFASLSGDERMVQLCNLEGLEQVRAWRKDLRPERLVAYATADLRFVRNTIRAEGAAIQNWQGWHHIRFSCVLSPDHERVVAFEFALGTPIPEDQWEADHLPAGHEADDD
jgi:hypothetical protein